MGIGRDIETCGVIVHTARDDFQAHAFYSTPSTAALGKKKCVARRPLIPCNRRTFVIPSSSSSLPLLCSFVHLCCLFLFLQLKQLKLPASSDVRCHEERSNESCMKSFLDLLFSIADQKCLDAHHSHPDGTEVQTPGSGEQSTSSGTTPSTKTGANLAVAFKNVLASFGRAKSVEEKT